MGYRVFLQTHKAESHGKTSVRMFRECSGDTLVDCNMFLPPACQNQSDLRQSLLNNRDWHPRTSLRSGQNGPEEASDRATTTHLKSRCQRTNIILKS